MGSRAHEAKAQTVKLRVCARTPQLPAREGPASNRPHGLINMDTCYRGFGTGDESQILDLYRHVFASSQTTAQWRWSYAENPLGRGEIVLALAGPLVIGHAAGVPLGFRQGQQAVRMSRIQHLMVHPNFRRRGVISEAVVQLTGRLAADGVDMLLGFTRDGRHSMPALLRIGAYRHAFDLLPWEGRFPAGGAIPPNVHVEFDDTVRFDDADVRCAERLLDSLAVCNRRDLQYLNWRYRRASGKRYTVVRVRRDGQLLGWAAVKPYAPTRSLDLVECVLPPEPSLMSALLQALADRFRGSEVDRFSLWSMEHYPLHPCLVDLGFTAEPRPTHVVIAMLSSRCAVLGSEPSAFYLSMGDSDVY